jgi:hypothetical protein
MDVILTEEAILRELQGVNLNYALADIGIKSCKLELPSDDEVNMQLLEGIWDVPISQSSLAFIANLLLISQSSDYSKILNTQPEPLKISDTFLAKITRQFYETNYPMEIAKGLVKGKLKKRALYAVYLSFYYSQARYSRVISSHIYSRSLIIYRDLLSKKYISPYSEKFNKEKQVNEFSFEKSLGLTSEEYFYIALCFYAQCVYPPALTCIFNLKNFIGRIKGSENVLNKKSLDKFFNIWCGSYQSFKEKDIEVNSKYCGAKTLGQELFVTRFNPIWEFPVVKFDIPITLKGDVYEYIIPNLRVFILATFNEVFWKFRTAKGFGAFYGMLFEEYVRILLKNVFESKLRYITAKRNGKDYEFFDAIIEDKNNIFLIEAKSGRFFTTKELIQKDTFQQDLDRIVGHTLNQLKKKIEDYKNNTIIGNTDEDKEFLKSLQSKNRFYVVVFDDIPLSSTKYFKEMVEEYIRENTIKLPINMKYVYFLSISELESCLEHVRNGLYFKQVLDANTKEANGVFKLEDYKKVSLGMNKGKEIESEPFYISNTYLRDMFNSHFEEFRVKLDPQSSK